jgi:hypothetical protein
MKLKLFADHELFAARKNHVPMLYPFWGMRHEYPQYADTAIFARYVAQGQHLFELVPLPEADIAVLPSSWESVLYNRTHARATRFVEDARAAQKATIIFFHSDSDAAIPLRDVVIFRTTFYRSTRKPYEFALPAWSEDITRSYLGGAIQPRPKRATPVVGFCGYAGEMQPLKRLVRWGKTVVGVRNPRNTGFVARRRALRALAASPHVATNFRMRQRYFGGTIATDGKADVSALQQVRSEFVTNMLESDYVLCARGAGNYSFRLYETLSAGRIPVFVDTDCVLPYENDIDWQRLCVWVDQREVQHIGAKVAAFHAALSDEAFIALQHECRRIWETYLSPEGFFTHLHRHLALC